MSETETEGSSLRSVGDFFSDRYVFITGGTGFIGKVLIEKLLRCCPGIAGIFVLMRPKKGRNVKQRHEDLCNSGVFKLLREKSPRCLEKIRVVQGEMTKEDFGIEGEMLELVCRNTSVFFHVAATVRFDEPLRTAVETNLVAVQKAANLARKMDHLAAFVHVSTAYANCNREHIDEIVYKPTIEPDNLLDVIQWLPDDAVNAMTPHLLRNMPNTYTFTKGLAEYFLTQKNADLPLVIVRPSIVTASWKEPFPGWIDSFGGLNNLLIATGKGFLRCVPGKGHAVADVIPVDITVNVMIAAAWRTGSSTSQDRIEKQVQVYNCTTGSINPIKWSEIESSASSAFNKYPLDLALRAPNLSFTTNPLMYNYWISVSHLLPAYITDMALVLVGKKPRLVKTFSKLHKAVECVQFFTSHQWYWATDNIMNLLNQLSPEDAKMFYLSAKGLDWAEYMETYCLGTKKFILKEDLKDLPQARRHLRRLQVLRYVFNTFLIAMLWRFLIANSRLAGGLWHTVLHLVFKFVRFCRFSTSLR